MNFDYTVTNQDNPYLKTHRSFFYRDRQNLSAYWHQVYVVAIHPFRPVAYIGFDINDSNKNRVKVHNIVAWTTPALRRMGINKRLNELMVSYLETQYNGFHYYDSSLITKAGEKSYDYRLSISNALCKLNSIRS